MPRAVGIGVLKFEEFKDPNKDSRNQEKEKESKCSWNFSTIIVFSSREINKIINLLNCTSESKISTEF